ncbi:uncharacterized protein LOC113512658 [Galleria mellonella]|uniref:Uncharacterized protein LOC113512658 n=2 Tax=Galleria mellonella TaxID=7137 RepID=A0ABM3MIH2_GALME|nr:uncharacterized protein LOC128200010 [Galleria mellonella]XP_052751186.1 uncharacterized protein LOC113512658 [Galleria mellonella]
MQLQILVLLWYSSTFVEGDTRILPIPSKSGLYFEENGEILISENSWKLLVYRDLEPLFLTHDSIKRLTQNYQNLVARHTTLPSVITTSSFIKASLNKIDSRLSELNYYTAGSLNNKRSKRELIDGVSSILKWLIGTPDAKDAKHYNECIEQLERQQISTDAILRQQLQIISSTIKNFNETLLKISYDEHLINENIAKVNSYFNTTNKLIFNLTISEEISTLAIQILESVTSLEKDIDDIIISILFIKSGAIHPSIISINRLYKELLSSSPARVNKNLVAPIKLSNIHQILESASITSYIYMNKIIYILEFPLVRNDRFTLYHIYSIPILHPSSTLYSTILPEQTFLAMNSNRQQYVTMNDLGKCKNFVTETKVCNDLPVYNVNTRPTCETAILTTTRQDVPEICQVTTFSANINTLQPIRNNKWIYILQHTTPYTLECKDETNHGEISGAGIISLENGCKMYTAFVTLLAEENLSTNISHPIVTVDLEQICIPENLNIREPELLPIKLNNIALDSLNTIKEQINQHSKLLKDNQATFVEKYSTKLSISSIAIGLAMLTCLCYKCHKRRFQFTTTQRRDGCIQIFNNCFDRSQRRQHIEIPMASLEPRTTSCISEDESDDVATPHLHQRSSNKTQSLF